MARRIQRDDQTRENQDRLIYIIEKLNSNKFNKDYTHNLKDCLEKDKLLSDLRKYLAFLRNSNIPKQIIKNKKYPFFFQSYFTAGDEEQFIQYSKIDQSYDPQTVINTFKYLFYKYKKALYVRVKNNKIDIFLPFTNPNYLNEWGDLIKSPNGFKDIPSFLEFLSNLQGYRFNPNKIQKSTKNWYANNCLLRYEYPFVEEDTSIPLLHNMISETCKNERVPDVEFFVHKRDFPVRRLDGTESYEAIFGVGKKLLSHKYDKYSHILCFCTTKDHADLCLPTWEDWCIVSQPEGKFFTDSCRDYNPDIGKKITWESKRPIAVFRGSTTGCGVTPSTNPRLKLACLSDLNIIDEKDNLPYLDAAITKWNIRPRAINGVLTTIDITKPPLKAVYDKKDTVKFLSSEDQARFKYIINVEGHVQAFRLSFELSLGSVILFANDSKYYTWMTKSLMPWVHYVPIKSNLEDLYEKIKWCKLHDNECRIIANNARIFYERYINKGYMMHYVSILLKSLA